MIKTKTGPQTPKFTASNAHLKNDWRIEHPMKDCKTDISRDTNLRKEISMKWIWRTGPPFSPASKGSRTVNAPNKKTKKLAASMMFSIQTTMLTLLKVIRMTTVNRRMMSCGRTKHRDGKVSSGMFQTSMMLKTRQQLQQIRGGYFLVVRWNLPKFWKMNKLLSRKQWTN